MDLRQRLHSILTPDARPATHSLLRAATVSLPEKQVFAERFAEAAVRAAAVSDTPAKAAVETPFPAPLALETAEPDPADPAPVLPPGAPGAPPDAVLPAPLWPARRLFGSGATGIGIDGSDAGVATMIDHKFERYTNPEAFGVTLNVEGRLFRDAVTEGHVPGTREGLETFLAWESMGIWNHDMTPSGKPPEIHAFLTQWHAING